MTLPYFRVEMDGEPNVALLYHHSEISKHLKGRFEEVLVTLWPSLVLDAGDARRCQLGQNCSPQSFSGPLTYPAYLVSYIPHLPSEVLLT